MPVIEEIRAAMNNDDGGVTAMIDDLRERMSSWVGHMSVGPLNYKFEADHRDPDDVASAIKALKALTETALAKLGAMQPAKVEGSAAGAEPRLPGCDGAPATALPPLLIEQTIEHSLALNAATRADKTRREYRSYYKEFAAWLSRRGITRLVEVTTAIMSEYKVYLLTKMEVTSRKKKEGKATDSPPKQGLAPKTFNKRWTCLGVLFKDAKGAGHYPKTEPSPTSGHLLKKRAVKRSVKSWLALTPEDLVTIFDPDVFLGWVKPHEFWVPLILLHHGPRIGEASQLSTTDIRQVDGVWIVSVNDDAEGTTLKSEASTRKVPLHPALIELGLLVYVDEVRRLVGNGFLFPYLRPDPMNGMGKVPGATLNGYMARRLDHPRKRAHSFRHTVNQRLRDGKVSEENRCQFIGHEHDTINSTIYSSQLPPGVLADIVFPLLTFPIDYKRLAYQAGRFDKVLVAEMSRRQRQLTHKVAKTKRLAKVQESR